MECIILGPICRCGVAGEKRSQSVVETCLPILFESVESKLQAQGRKRTTSVPYTSKASTLKSVNFAVMAVCLKSSQRFTGPALCSITFFDYCTDMQYKTGTNSALNRPTRSNEVQRRGSMSNSRTRRPFSKIRTVKLRRTMRLKSVLAGVVLLSKPMESPSP